MMRRYMNNCGTWTSSYRLVLALIQEFDASPQFARTDLVLREGDDESDVAHNALWEVFFTRLAALQEYGWHSGIEELLWASDRLNGALISLDWDKLKPELSRRQEEWTDRVINHAKENSQFFPKHDEELETFDQERR